MAIKFGTVEDVASVLHKGMMDGIRHNLKTKIMTEIEKEINGVIDQTIKQMKGYVESYRDNFDGQVKFNITINGVPQPGPTSNTQEN